MIGVSGMVVADPEQARRLLEDELADPRYQREYSGPLRQALDQLLSWFGDATLDLGPMSIPYGPLIAALLVIVGIVACIVLVRPRLQRTGTAETALDIETGVTAEQLRARAQAHQAAGDYDAAYRELYRAVMRAGEERGLLSDQRGRTATEAAQSLAAQVAGTAGSQSVSLETDIHRAAELFNLSRYGGAQLGRSEVDRLFTLDAALNAAAAATGQGSASGGGSAGRSRSRLVAPQ